MKQRCVVMVGRLIGHPCARTASFTCAKCGRSVCQAHCDAENLACVVCTGAHRPVHGTIEIGLEEMLSFVDTEIAAFGESGGESHLHDYES